MSQSLRVRVCSGCGHLLVRAASCSGNATKNRSIEYSSRRSASWRSIFGLENTIPDQHGTKSKPPDDSRTRAKETVRQLREAKDRTARASMTESIHRKTISELLTSKSTQRGQKDKTVPRQTPKTRNEIETRAITSPPFPRKLAISNSSTLSKGLRRLEVNEAPIERLLQLQLQKNSVTKPSREARPSPFFLPVSEKKTYEYSKKIRDSDLPGSTSSTNKPFLTPFRAEQQGAISKYLALAKKDSDIPGKFPWEEDGQTAPSVILDATKDRSGRLPTTSRISMPNRSTPASKADSSGLGKSLSMETFGDVDLGYVKGKALSKLHQQLRNHHVRSRVKNHRVEIYNAQQARLLHLQIEKIVQQLMTTNNGRWGENQSEYILMLRQFGVSMRNAFMSKRKCSDSELGPLGVFTLAKWGINPYRSGGVQRSLEIEDFDEFGEVKRERLIAISQSCTPLTLLTEGMIPPPPDQRYLRKGVEVLTQGSN
jgi:hypothetical protein